MKSIDYLLVTDDLKKSLTTVTVIILYKSERDERLKGSRLPTLFMFIK